MALVHQNSCECTKSELDLFGVPPTQTSVEHGYWEQKGLTSTLTDQGPYEFPVSGAGDDYIDLFNTYLFVEAQIVNTDGSNLEPDTDVGSVDLWMHSLFSDVSVSLNVCGHHCIFYLIHRCAGKSMGAVTRTLRHPREATDIVKTFVHRLINKT